MIYIKAKLTTRHVTVVLSSSKLSTSQDSVAGLPAITSADSSSPTLGGAERETQSRANCVTSPSFIFTVHFSLFYETTNETVSWTSSSSLQSDHPPFTNSSTSISMLPTLCCATQWYVAAWSKVAFSMINCKVRTSSCAASAVTRMDDSLSCHPLTASRLQDFRQASEFFHQLSKLSTVVEHRSLDILTRPLIPRTRTSFAYSCSRQYSRELKNLCSYHGGKNL